MKRLELLALFCFLLFSPRVFAQNISNEGTDFWAVFPTHIASGTMGTTQTNHGNIAIFVTSKLASKVTVSCGAYTDTKLIPANTAVQFDVTWANAYINASEANGNLVNRGIHIKVADGSPKVSAYAHIYGQARSAASLILPYETLGQTYYSMNYTQLSGAPQGNNFLTLVAAEANTTILLHEKSGNVKTIVLANAGDAYEYMPNDSGDLTGVYAEVDATSSSCKRFAAFSGSSVLYIGCSGSQDPLYQQLYPTVSWGRNYGVVPFIDRRCIVRILAQEDNTNVTYNGQTVTLNKGQFHESQPLTESTSISSDKLISVAEYSFTQACSATNGGNLFGDPEMVILNPIEFNIKGITVFSSLLQNITSQYLNILIRANKASTFKINGVAPITTWTPLNGNTSYAYAQIGVSGSSLTLTADDGFNAIAYGFGNAESYAYSAGTNLLSNNYLTVVNDVRGVESPNGCVGQELAFKINLPYQPDKITWTLDSETPIETLSPVPETKTVNGQTFYIYSYPVKKTYTAKGEYHLSVEAHVPNNASSCVSGNLITNYVFTIYDLPTVDFDFAQSSCAKTDVVFTDKSVSNTTDYSITSWVWDFGDGQTSAEQNPKHQYTDEGSYNVSLSVRSGTGCFSNPAPFKTILIYPLPVSKFTTATKTCINTNIVLTDQSTISTSLPKKTITKWHWDFGDGSTPQDKLAADPFTYQYTTPGTYTIKLTTTSNNDCQSDVFSFKIEVTDLPVADFSMPDVCLNDALAAFVSNSKGATGGTGSFSYNWTFGDAASTPGNPNVSNTKDGTHKYATAGTYQVTLKITNANGCVSNKTQDFTVNGAVEKADFTVQNETSLCSNTDVIINNSSSAFFGKITKIVVYKDFLNAPEDYQTILYPTATDIHLTYPTFGGNSTKPYTIRLVAYSGETCFQIKDKVITLKPAPQLVFLPIPSVCQNDGSVLINQATETSGILGKGAFSGAGINPDGNFNPKLVNVGQHVITYTFSADNGCPSVITQVVNVYKSPTADAGPTIYILTNGQTVIPAVAEGDNLTYHWTPAVGLSDVKILNPIATPEKDTEYTLLATTSDGCTVTTSVNVKVLEALIPPNSFTPNGDNVNDVWNIKYLDTYPKATVEVFNRNGIRVFFSEGYKLPFDGNYQNEPLPVGVYYYLINPRNGRKTVTGPLTIIR